MFILHLVASIFTLAGCHIYSPLYLLYSVVKCLVYVGVVWVVCVLHRPPAVTAMKALATSNDSLDFLAHLHPSVWVCTYPVGLMVCVSVVYFTSWNLTLISIMIPCTVGHTFIGESSCWLHTLKTWRHECKEPRPCCQLTPHQLQTLTDTPNILLRSQQKDPANANDFHIHRTSISSGLALEWYEITAYTCQYNPSKMY